MGMPLHAVTRTAAIEQVTSELASGRGGIVLTPNLDILRRYRRSASLREEFERAQLVVVDGTPLVWAARLQGTPVPERITGTDMLWSLVAAAAAHGRSIHLAGGPQGVARRARERMESLHPGLTASSRACYVEPQTAARELEGLATALVEAAPDIAFIGLPFVTQVEVMSSLRARLPGTWFVGIGSSFEFVTGDRTRAPGAIQRAGLEWAFRLLQQPWLWRRYLVHGLPFAARLGLHALRRRFAGVLAPRRRVPRVQARS